MPVLRLTTPAHVPATVAATLGFTPSESLVVLGLQGGPSARIDLPDAASIAEAVNAFLVMEEHWIPDGILVVVYADVPLLDVEHAFAALMPAVTVRHTLRVLPNGDVTAGGRVWAAVAPDDPMIAATVVAPSRDALVAEAAEVDDPDVAWVMAREAYAVGAGPRAWCYLDRLHEIAPPSVRSQALDACLRHAVPPTSELGQAVIAS